MLSQTIKKPLHTNTRVISFGCFVSYVFCGLNRMSYVTPSDFIVHFSLMTTALVKELAWSLMVSKASCKY